MVKASYKFQILLFFACVPLGGGTSTKIDECFHLKHKERVFDISPLKVESIK